MNSIENQVCEAIEIIAERIVSQAQYDKTIQGTVVECVDQTIGKFKIKYQDSVFYAYSNNSDVTYSNGSTVYILVPNGDMSKDKTILGSTSKLGIDYVSTIENDAAYEINGNNCIITTDSFELCSYTNSYTKILYHKDYLENQNSIKLDIPSVNEYIRNSTHIICGAIFQTNLPQEQQYNGNYGIIFALDFIDNTNNETVTRYYIVDIDTMIGNPYKIITKTRQYGIFDIDNKNFSEVKYISIFCKDFPNTAENKNPDIFISDIELNGALLLSNDDINSYSLTFITPQGTFFDETSLSSDIKKIQAQIRVKGQIVDNDSQDLFFYWFVEHVGITSQNQYYNKYGGQGWKCLNNYNIIGKVENSETDVVEWIPANYEWQVKKEDITAKEVKYKCAVVYGGTVISKTIIIKNLTSNYNLEINSDIGTQFYFDIGFPTLTCKVNGEENKNYTYSWAVTNNAGAFQSIEGTPSENKSYEDAYNNYITLYNNIKDETVPEAPNRLLLQQYKDELDSFDKITRVDKNVIYHLNVNTITLFSTYQCTVYYRDLYIGTTSITLYNSLQINGAYSLVINGGSYVYKYNENGVSPASSALDSSIDIQGLSFTVYDNLGEPIDDEVIRHCNIKWIVPTVNTLIKIPNSYVPISTTETTATYENLMNFNYQIADRYDITKNNNNIQLLVDYKGTNLAAITDFTFVKEGESGTNGTEFSCKIIPNTPSGSIPPMYPTITELSNGNWELNYIPVNIGKWFRVQLWHNEMKISDSVSTTTSNEGKSVNIVWDILSNSYTGRIADSSSFIVDRDTGTFSYNGYRYDHPANIVRATVVYDGVTYYATLPVYTVKVSNNDYRLNLKDGTGFRYATYTSDGQAPKYDNVNPFELIVTQNVGSNIYEDVSLKTTSNYAVTYGWNLLGRVYEDNLWVNKISIAEKTLTDIKQNQKDIKPLDDFNGQCVTNALEGIVYRLGTEVARIHMPIHLLLNKYGNSSINGWDGNSVNLTGQGGFILAPQVGAGIKEKDNSFTGVVIGKVKETNSSKEEIGLFGYAKGVRSIFMDAYTGKSQFGVSGKGQIIIDPTSNRAQIYSGNYSTSAKTGLMIDLTTPEIRFGSGNFSVDSNGYVTAVGGGSIAGWNISNTSLYKGKVGISSDYQNDNSIAFWAGGYSAESAPFRVTFGGRMYSTDGVFSGSLSGANITGAIGTFSGGINVNNKFIVDTNGNVTLPSGTAISWNQITNGNSIVTSITENTIQTTNVIANNLKVNSANINGKLTASQINTTGLIAENISATTISSKTLNTCTLNSPSGNIGGWTIGTNGLYSSYAHLNTTELKYGNNFTVDYNGNVTATGVNLSGQITATSGKIGDFTIQNGSLVGNSVAIYGSQIWANNITSYSGNTIDITSGLDISYTLTAQQNVYFPQVYRNLSSSGSANVHITSTGYLNRTSESLEKYKHSIKFLSNKEIDQNKLYSVPVKEFIYNEDYLDIHDSRYGKFVPGFTVEDLLKFYPIAVDYEDGKPINWNPRYIIPGMLKLIQEQKKILDILLKERDKNGRKERK